MTSSLLDEYHTLNTIIEQDKRVSSFKYALLRAAIEICQQYDHLEEQRGDVVWYPTGLLIERWIFYYYPIFASDVFIPQLNGERDLGQETKHISFRRPLSEIIRYYRIQGGGITEFYADYRKGTIPDELQETMRDLIRTIRKAIIEGPFEHLGQSQSRTKEEKFLVFDWDRERLVLPHSRVCQEYLIQHSGTFSFSKNLADLFKYFGSFILGEGSILNKWAEFTTHIGKAQGLFISREQILQVLASSPDTEREVQLAVQFYRDILNRTGEVCCVWSGYRLRSQSELHIDHMLPYSLWKNNDLWNLMPARDRINAQKRDAIPSPDFIVCRRNAICSYWNLLAETYPDLFYPQITAALTGKRLPNSDWMGSAFNGLIQKSRYLIDIRGYAAWAL